MTRSAKWHLDEAERYYDLANKQSFDLESRNLARAQYHATMAVAVSTKPKAYPNTGPK